LKNNKQLDFSITWVGKKVYSMPERAEYINLMEQKIKEYDLTNYWYWIEPTQNIKEFYLGHDALVHASYREGLPNVVCESLACGLPVILSDILDHPILADHGQNGILFDHTKPEKLADAILEFYSFESSKHMAMRKQCRNFAEKHFSEQRFLSEYKDIIKKITEDA